MRAKDKTNRASKGRKRNNARHQAKTIEVPENPFAIFNEGPGNRSLRQNYLIQRQRSLIFVIEPLWHEFGWELKCARTTEQVHQAFQIIAEKVNLGSPLAPILRVTSEAATKASIQRTRARLTLAVEKSGPLANAYQAQLRTYEDCQRLKYGVSEKFKAELEKDLARRRENIRAIKINISKQKGEIRKAQLQKSGESPANELNLPTLERELKRFEDDRAADEVVCINLDKRIGSITKNAKKVVEEETVRQKEKLDSLEQESSKADLECRELETILLDQEAFFFRSQLLDFIQKTDYEFTPRNVANALAGLPYITSRRSAELCARIKNKIALFRNYEVLMLIASVWKRSDKKGYLTVPEWFKLQIRNLPNYKIVKRKKSENSFRTYLAGKWFFLGRALERLQGSKPPPGFVAYAITREFLRQLHNPESPADSILAENNKITD